MFFNIQPINPLIMELSVAGAVRDSSQKDLHRFLNNDSNENNHLQHNVSFGLKKNITVRDCSIGEQYFLTFINGNSMLNRDISSGDILLWDSNIDIDTLKSGEIILIRMTDNSENKPRVLKLRIFDKMEKGKVYTSKYDNNDIESSGNIHSIDSIVGKKKSIVRKKDLDYINIMTKNLESCYIEIKKNDSDIYLTKALNIDIFLESIYDFKMLSESGKEIMKKYTLDQFCIKRDTELEAKNVIKNKIKRGLSLFKHLTSKNEYIDDLSSIYFKCLLSIDSNLKFT